MCIDIHIKPTACFLGFGRGISGFFCFFGVSGFKKNYVYKKLNLTKYISSYLPWVFPLLRTFLTESDFASQPGLKSQSESRSVSKKQTAVIKLLVLLSNHILILSITFAFGFDVIFFGVAILVGGGGVVGGVSKGLGS